MFKVSNSRPRPGSTGAARSSKLDVSGSSRLFAFRPTSGGREVSRSGEFVGSESRVRQRRPPQPVGQTLPPERVPLLPRRLVVALWRGTPGSRSSGRDGVRVHTAAARCRASFICLLVRPSGSTLGPGYGDVPRNAAGTVDDTVARTRRPRRLASDRV